jgi:glucosylceramidase
MGLASPPSARHRLPSRRPRPGRDRPGRRRGRGRLAAGLLAGLLSVGAATAQATGPNPDSVAVLLTDPAAHVALAPAPPLTLTTGAPPAGLPVITLAPTVRGQRISGFGAAMTDSSAALIEGDLTPAARQALMTELFSPAELDLRVLRVPIGASDFTANGVPYSYDDGPPDPTLRRFSIARDRAAVLPALHQALAVDPHLSLLATPWSVPAWMKSNDSLDNVANRGTLKPAAGGEYGAYMIRFLQAYRAAGIPIAAITPANEPGNPTSYPGMNIPPAFESALINAALAARLHRAGLHVQIYGADLGWGSPAYARAIASGDAARNLAGIAWHCYYGPPTVMGAVHLLDPRLGVIVSECSPGISTVPISEIVIQSLREDASEVLLWNLALDPAGGPVQAPNRGCPGCSGLVTIDPASHTVTPTLSLDELGQASEIFAPGAVRIASNTFVSDHYVGPGRDYLSAGLDDVAAVEPDGSLALMVYDHSPAPITFAVADGGAYFTDTLAAGATASFHWG